MESDVVVALATEHQEEVAKKVEKYNLLAIPVVDTGRQLLGIITHDDVIDVVREELAEDAQRIAAVAPLEEQKAIETLVKALPGSVRASREAQNIADSLIGELRWQFRLTILVGLNVIVTSIALVLLWKAYQNSQDSLRDAMKLSSEVLSCMDQGVLTTDICGIVTSINRRGRELLKVDGTIVGKPICDFEPLPLKKFFNECAQGGTKETECCFNLDNHGRMRRLSVSSQQLKDYQGHATGRVMQVRDVTEHTLMEERLRRMERYMGLGSLAGGLHHEIKNPLAALSLHAQLLEEHLSLEADQDEARGMLQVIRAEILRIGRVLESFRDFASLGRLSPTQVEVGELIDSCLALLRPQCARSLIQVVFDSKAELPCYIMADRLRAEQVLINIVINAIEAMPGGGMLTVVLAEDESSVSIEVRDTGRGIPEALHDKVLDPYFTTKGSGTGLGLAICDKIMRQHAGNLEFDSSSAGTSFRISFPIHQHATLQNEYEITA